MNKFAASIATGFVVLGASTAGAAVITFEGLLDGTVITNQFAGVTFSANAGQQNEVTTQPGIGFGDNFICTTAIGSSSINCTNETILTFDSGVSNLSFYQVGDNASGVGALVDVFTGGAFSSTVNVLTDNTFNTPNLVDLTSFADVTSIRIYNVTDPGGLGWDNFDFTVSEIPIPASALLLLSGAGILVGMRRRKRE